MTTLRKPTGQHGFTLVEMMIAVSILSVVLVGITQFFLRSSRAFTAATVKSYTSARAQVVVDRLVEECAAGRFVSLVPPVPTLSTWIRFQKIVGVVDVTPIYGNPYHIETVPGADGRNEIRVWEDFPPHSTTPGAEDSPTTLATNVESLLFTRKGSVLEIDVTFAAEINVAGEIFSYRLVTGVKMRN